MRIALYQPEIAGNVGAILRLAACLAVPVEIIEPCGFVFDDKRLKRAAMDYGPLAEMTRHADWPSFQAFARDSGARLVLMSSKASTSIYRTAFEDNPEQRRLLLRLWLRSDLCPPADMRFAERSVAIDDDHECTRREGMRVE